MDRRFLWSMVALTVGILLFLGGIASLGKHNDNEGFLGGLLMIIGALVYRSAKKRKLGMRGIVKNIKIRQVGEIIALTLLFTLVLRQNFLIEEIVNHPISNFVIPIWTLIAYLIISFKTSKKITIGLAIFIISFSIIMISKADKTVIKTEEDMQYFIGSIDVSKKNFDPKVPKNELQKTLSDYMNELNELNTTSTSMVANIGPIEFSSNFAELKDRPNVILLKANLKRYWDVRKNYYDKADALLKKYTKKLGYGKDHAERLEGTALQELEKVEEKYILDLNNFYDFVLKHHASMIFTKGQIQIENNKSVDDLNKLWSAAVKSSTDLTTYQENMLKMRNDFMATLKKEADRR